MIRLLTCVALLTGCVTAAPPRPVAKTTPAPAAPGVFFGTGLAAPIDFAICEHDAHHCAFADRTGRLAIIERSTGAVLATQFFGEVEELRFDDSGLRLGVTGHHFAVEWSWRSGEVTSLADSRYRGAPTLGRRWHAWSSGGGVGEQVVVTPRAGGQSRVFPTGLVKVLHVVDDDRLLVVHTDSLELLRVRDDAPLEVIAAATLPPEPEPRLRSYGHRPVVQLSRSFLWVEADATKVLLFTKSLELVRTLERPRGALFVDPDSDRYAFLEELESGFTKVSLRQLEPARELAHAEVKFSGSGRVHFTPDRIVFSSWRGIWHWQPGEPPVEVHGSAQTLAVVADQRVEMQDSSVQFTPLTGQQPASRSSSFGASLVKGELDLFDDHAVLTSRRDGCRTETWSASGVSELFSEPVKEPTRQGDTFNIAGRTLRFAPNELAPASFLVVNGQQSRAVVTLANGWRLYDVKSGAVLAKGKTTLEWDRQPATFSDDGAWLLIADDQWLTLHDDKGRVRGRFQHFKPDPNALGMRGGSGPPTHVVWTPESIVVAIEEHVWFLKSPSLELIAQHTTSDLMSLEATRSGVAAFERSGLTLFDPRGVVRRHFTQHGPQALSADGALIAFCDADRFKVVDPLGETVDEDATVCARATSISVSDSLLGSVRDGVVEFVRRDDRTRWSITSLAAKRPMVRMGPARGDPPLPPERALLIRSGDAFDSWPPASKFVTTVGRITPATGLLEKLWPAREGATPPKLRPRHRCP
ncbi:MAG: hypothetical protein GQE15_22415 [Archangiaceae bacterium]|nr:hypothetical protein [Archangiaceae bacterium]